nr:zinc finger protein 2-like isoform X3 [Dermacentor andersoni]
MTGKETARPYLTMSGGSCYVDQGASSAAPDLDFGRVPGETREASGQQRENQATNTIQECHVCRFGLTDTEAFQKHAANHSLGKNHNCSECGKLFVSASKLTRHLGIHREPSVECSVCGEKFRTKDSRRQHMYAYHVGSQP